MNSLALAVLIYKACTVRDTRQAHRLRGSPTQGDQQNLNNHCELPRKWHGQNEKCGRVSGLKEGLLQEPGSDPNSNVQKEFILAEVMEAR